MDKITDKDLKKLLKKIERIKNRINDKVSKIEKLRLRNAELEKQLNRKEEI